MVQRELKKFNVFLIYDNFTLYCEVKAEILTCYFKLL